MRSGLKISMLLLFLCCTGYNFSAPIAMAMDEEEILNLKADMMEEALNQCLNEMYGDGVYKNKNGPLEKEMETIHDCVAAKGIDFTANMYESGRAMKEDSIVSPYGEGGYYQFDVKNMDFLAHNLEEGRKKGSRPTGQTVTSEQMQENHKNNDAHSSNTISPVYISPHQDSPSKTSKPIFLNR